MLEVPLWGWIATVGAILALIVLDFATVSRHPHEVRLREAAAWSTLYIGIALAFGILVWLVWDGDAAVEYLAGWLVEKSLSVDNLFVFVVVIATFAVPAAYQQRVLLFGVAAALVLRGAFIAAGAAAIQRFSVTFLAFGGLLVWTAVQLFRHRDQDPDIDDNAVLRWARRRLPATDNYAGARLTTVQDGRRVVTPLFFVLVAIGTTDLLFALDSIPAVFGVTQEPYLVFTANAFALLGLRALYFLLHGLLDRLVYLSVGLSVILAFIGAKLIVTFLHELNPAVPHVPIALSLAVIVAVLAVTTVASVLAARRDPSRRARPAACAATGRTRLPRPPAAPPDGSAAGARGQTTLLTGRRQETAARSAATGPVGTGSACGTVVPWYPHAPPMRGDAEDAGGGPDGAEVRDLRPAVPQPERAGLAHPRGTPGQADAASGGTSPGPAGPADDPRGGRRVSLPCRPPRRWPSS